MKFSKYLYYHPISCIFKRALLLVFLLLYGYGKATDEWDELLGGPTNSLLVIIIVITYPIFYLFWLPWVLYHLVLLIGSPKEVWQRMFENTFFTLDKLIPDLVYSKGELIVNYIYIGIPFFLFCVIYIGLVILLVPLWYFIFSPIGYGVFGIALNVSFHFPSTTSLEIEDRIDRTHRVGTFIHVYVECLPLIIISAVHVGIVGNTWYGILLLVLSIINFVVDCYTAIKNLFCNNDIIGV